VLKTCKGRLELAKMVCGIPYVLFYFLANFIECWMLTWTTFNW